MDQRIPLPAPPPPPAGHEPEPEQEQVETRSKRPLVGAVVALALIVGAVVAVGVWIAAPGRCEGSSFTSSRFSYCLTTPAGWQSREVSEQGQAYDSFLQEGGSANVLVSASPMPEGAGLEELVEGVRAGAEQQGLVLEATTPLTVAGVPARQFDAELENDQGQRIAFRIVVFRHGETYWIVRLQDTPERFAGNASDLRGMLRSWQFI